MKMLPALGLCGGRAMEAKYLAFTVSGTKCFFVFRLMRLCCTACCGEYPSKDCSQKADSKDDNG